MTELDSLYDLAAELQSLKKQAKALGVFTDDRDLLECQHCGLKESVTFENTLYTYCDDAFDDDTGLRFPEPDEDGYSRCPRCGASVKGEWF